MHDHELSLKMAELMGWDAIYEGNGTTWWKKPHESGNKYLWESVFSPPDPNDLNDAAALWRAAPEEVKEAVVDHISMTITNTRAWFDAILDAHRFTKALVEKWEEFNADL